MTNPDLAALSEAATKGEWLVEPDMRTDTRYTPEREEYEYLAGYDIRGDTEVIGCEGIYPGEQSEANAAFITTLVNEYRAGRLVQIDEGMRERVVDALRMTSDLSIVECAEVAPAVIAAMMGGAK